MKQFQDAQKLGGYQLISTFQMKLDTGIREKSKAYQQIYDRKRIGRFIEDWLPTAVGVGAALIPFAFRMFR